MGVYESIMQGLNEAVAAEKGQLKVRKIKCQVNPVPDFSAQEIKTLRNELEMSQITFAALMGVSSKTVEAWEAGTNKPVGAARRMMGMLRLDPNIPQKYNIVSL